MSFFNNLERFAGEVEKFFKGKSEALNLRSCKNCPYHKDVNGVLYCTQTSPPTRILSEYYAQGCIYYGAEQPVSGLMTKTEREDYKSLLDRIKKIDLVDLITEITTIGTLETLTSINLIDLINVISEITTIKKVEAIEGSVDPYSLTSKDKVLDKLELVYDAGVISAINGYEGEDQKFTLTFTWTEGALTEIVRT